MKYATLFALVAVAAAEGETKTDTKTDTKTAEANPCAIKTYKVYTDAKCTKADTEWDATKEKTFVDAAAKVKAGCDETSMTKITCAGGVKTELFTDAKCKTLDTEKMKKVKAEVKFGTCTDLTGGKWAMATGAKALMASAAVALAFVGSQF